MIRPSWLAALLAAVVVAAALFSAARLAASRWRRRHGELDADGMHVLMGVAMAGMFLPRLRTLPGPAWELVFAAGAVWFGLRAARTGRGRPVPGPGRPWPPGLSRRCCRYPLPHLVDCAAMLYMLWAVPVLGEAAAAGASAGRSGDGGMAGVGDGAVRLPAVGLLLALGICGYIVWLADRIPLLAPAAAAAPAAAPAPVAVMGPGSDPAARARSGAGPEATRVHSLLAPRVAICCKIAMGVAMGVMLIDLV